MNNGVLFCLFIGMVMCSANLGFTLTGQNGPAYIGGIIYGGIIVVAMIMNKESHV